MPIHEFKCNTCDHEFEEVLLPSDDITICCPKCASREVEKLISVGSCRPQGIPKGQGGFDYTPPPCKTGAGTGGG